MIDRSKNNVIGAMRHSVSCRLIQSDGAEPCDCTPLDDRAMRSADVLRIFERRLRELREKVKALKAPARAAGEDEGK